MTWVAAVWRVLAREIELRDVVFVVGLGMVGYGLAAAWPPAGWVVVGGVLARVAYGSRRSADPTSDRAAGPVIVRSGARR